MVEYIVVVVVLFLVVLNVVGLFGCSGNLVVKSCVFGFCFYFVGIVVLGVFVFLIFVWRFWYLVIY